MHLDTLEGINLLAQSSKTATSVWHNRFFFFFFKQAFAVVRAALKLISACLRDKRGALRAWRVVSKQKGGMPPLDRRLESSDVLLVWPDLVLKHTHKAKTSLKWHHRYIRTLTHTQTDIYSHFSVFHLKEILIGGQACGIQSYLVWILHYECSLGCTWLCTLSEALQIST